MTLRSLVTVVVLAFLGSAAVAAPKKPPPPVTGKPSKKQMEIEKREWMAQYHLRRANDLVAAAKEYQAILALDPENAGAALALASIYTRDKKDKQAIDVL